MLAKLPGIYVQWVDATLFHGGSEKLTQYLIIAIKCNCVDMNYENCIGTTKLKGVSDVVMAI